MIREEFPELHALQSLRKLLSVSDQLIYRRREPMRFSLKAVFGAIVCCSLLAGAYSLTLRGSFADRELIQSVKQTALGTKRALLLERIRQLPSESTVPTTIFWREGVSFLYDEWKLSDGRVLMVEYSDINGEILYDGYHLTGEIP